MFKKTKLFIWAAVIVGSVFSAVFSQIAFAADDVESLKNQIAVLEKRIAQLEAAQPQQEAMDNGPAATHRFRQWDPFEEMSRMQAMTDRMFRDSLDWGGNLSHGMFRSNMSYDGDFAIKEEKDKYIIEFDLAGLDQDKIDIQVNQRSITIKGEQSHEQKQEGKSNYFATKSYATFIRSIPTPANADTKRMKSEKNGDKLIITLPKKA